MKPGINHIGIYVAGICHDGKGNVLYAHRSRTARDEQEKWNIGAGGTLEVGETFEECLRRELKEEINVDVDDCEYLGCRELFREKDGVRSHWLGFYYKVLVDPETVKIMEDVCDELMWTSFHTPPTPMITNHEEVYELFKEHF